MSFRDQTKRIRGVDLYNLNWSKKELTRQKLGIFGEYYAKMFLISYGIDLYSTVVDDHGVDFVAETKKGFFKVQVKTIRSGTNYIFMGEKYFNISEKNLYLLIVHLLYDRLFLRQHLVILLH